MPSAAVSSLGVELIGRQDFDSLGKGEQLDAIEAQGLGDHVCEIAEAVVAVEDEDVEAVDLGGVKHFGELGDICFGIGEVDVEGAGCARYLLRFHGNFIVGGLVFAGDGGPDGEVHSLAF